ncbi:MAG: AAA family ATPase [Anaerolineae bacterium]|nr:AAA family ATPase [Anaerolineae bacterium]
MPDRIVAREQELDRLDESLNATLAGSNQVLLLTGSAGSGKTALIAEFIRRAREQHEQLLITRGNCDAYMGSGDPYLPFREVLTTLTGDVEDGRGIGSLGGENRQRLKGLLSLSAQVLVESGPDLVGTFVPGAKLWLGVGSVAVQKTDWYERLKKLADITQGQKLLGKGIEQTQIFEQYANVLRSLAQRAPVLVTLDDFHWADTDSVSLLFRLCRRLESSPVMIVSAYRPEELTAGRDGKRHPLEKAVVELRRYYGNITLDLDQAIETRGMEFVHQYLGLQPHHLTPTFEKRLFEQTGGHPLFTTEVLQTMRERGDLVRNAEGEWVAAATIDWASLPARIEGALEERLQRIDDALQDALELASVQGEQFSAEIIAALQHSDVRQLVRRLSGDLQDKHRLIEGIGVARIGRQRISTYQFTHKLIRTYLYGKLDEVERVYLHEDVGNALEALYGDEVDTIAAQLANHFELAQLNEKAAHYLTIAGDKATDALAFGAALQLYERALTIIPKNDLQSRFDLLLKRETLFDARGEREQQAVDLLAMEKLAAQIGTAGARATAALRHAWYANRTGNYERAIAMATVAVAALDSDEVVTGPDGDVLTDARICLGEALLRHNQPNEAAAQTELALYWARRANDPVREVKALQQLSLIAWARGDYEAAVASFHEALEASKSFVDQRDEAWLLSSLGMATLMTGRYSEALEHLWAALRLTQTTGDRRREAAALTNIAETFTNIGRYEQAAQIAEHALDLTRTIGEKLNEEFLLANLAEIALLDKSPELAQTYIQAALEVSGELDDHYGEAYMLGSAGIIETALGNLDAANDAFTRALAAWPAFEDPRGALRTQAGYAAFLLQRGGDGDYSAALTYAQKIADHFATNPEWSGGRTTLGLDILLTAYRVLAAGDDPGASDLLDKTHALLQARAAQITDPAMRKSYLGIAAHQQIQDAYADRHQAAS